MWGIDSCGVGKIGSSSTYLLFRNFIKGFTSFQNLTTPQIMQRLKCHQRILWGIVLGGLYGPTASLLAIGQDQMYHRCVIDVSKEINYANTIFYEIKAKEAIPERGGGDVENQHGVENNVGEPSRQEIESYIRQVFGSSGMGWANCIIQCECSYRADIVSSNGLYFGIFQFEPRTYYANGGTDINDWREQMRIAKELYDKGEQSFRWPACDRRCK